MEEVRPHLQAIVPLMSLDFLKTQLTVMLSSSATELVHVLVKHVPLDYTSTLQLWVVKLQKLVFLFVLLQENLSAR